MSARFTYPKSAEEREEAFNKHQKTEGSILISPSMTQGYDFKDDLARWQIICKIPFPSLGNPHVCAKKDLDESWYAQQTASTIIQTCGRIIRNEQDYGDTYILDADFKFFYSKWEKLFPKWFVSAINVL